MKRDAHGEDHMFEMMPRSPILKPHRCPNRSSSAFAQSFHSIRSFQFVPSFHFILPFLLVAILTCFLSITFSSGDPGPEPVDSDPTGVDYTLYPLAAGDNSTNGSLQYLRPAPVNDTDGLVSYNWTLRSGISSPLTVNGNFTLSLRVENPHNESASLILRVISGTGAGAVIAEGDHILPANETLHDWEIPLTQQPLITLSGSLFLEFRSDLSLNITYRDLGDYHGAALRFTGSGPVLEGLTFSPAENGTDVQTDIFYPNMPDELRGLILTGSLEGPFLGADGGDPALRITIFNCSDVLMARNYDLNYTWVNTTGKRDFKALWDYRAGPEPGLYRIEWKLSDDVHSFDYRSYFNMSEYGVMLDFHDDNATVRFGEPVIFFFTVRNTGAYADSYELHMELSDEFWSALPVYADIIVGPGQTTAGQVTLVPPYPFQEDNMSPDVEVSMTAFSRNDSARYDQDSARAYIDPIDLLPDFSIQKDEPINVFS